LQEANRVDDSVYFVTEPVELRLDGANVNAIVKSGHRTFEFECPINTFLASFANSAVIALRGGRARGCPGRALGRLPWSPRVNFLKYLHLVIGEAGDA
jgi:hypothetical protein